MAEYTELQLKAKEEGIKSWHVKSDDVLAKELAAKWEADANRVVPEDENDEVVIEETIKEAPKSATPAPEPDAPPAPKAEGKVTFYWKDKRNIEFSIETAKATPTSLRQAESFASKDSVLVLDPEKPVEAKAIEKLRKSPQFKIEFDEVDHRNANPAKKGAKLDELMALEHSVLVQMVGGSVQDHRKTKGELIHQLLG